MNKDEGEPAYEKPFPAPQCERTLCPEVPSEEYRTGKSLSALYMECPYREPPIEVVPVESEEATPKVHYNNGDNDGWDWGLLSSKSTKKEKRKRLA